MTKYKHMYIHIPFCKEICFYCDFIKQVLPKNKKDVFDYLFLVKKEIESYKNELNDLETIYIGGGTPSCLDEEELTFLLDCISKFGKVKEISIELNPDGVEESILKILKKYNVNRLSIGVQTFNNVLLKKIGRTHSVDDIISLYKKCRKLGFDNISFDLIYNLFDQTIDDIKNDLKYIEELNPDHISWYSLILKENSIWGKKKLSAPENDVLYDDVVNEGLEKLNYTRYEVSNYAKNNKFSEHNIGYWLCNPFIGIGYGAHGYEEKNGKYYLTENKGKILSYRKKYNELSQEEHFFNKLMMGLRLVSGISISDNNDVYSFYKDKIENLVASKLLIIDDDYLRCTKRGYEILNDVLINFI